MDGWADPVPSPNQETPRLDKVEFSGNLLKPLEALTNKVQLALRDATRIKRMMQHLRALFRDTAASYSPKIKKLKDRLIVSEPRAPRGAVKKNQEEKAKGAAEAQALALDGNPDLFGTKARVKCVGGLCDGC